MVRNMALLMASCTVKVCVIVSIMVAMMDSQLSRDGRMPPVSKR